MSKWSGQSSDMWSKIPNSVLNDDNYTASVGPIRGGSSALPPKTGKYTTTRGKLTQDEANALARGFTPSTIAGNFVNYDDQWVKYNAGTPEADALYRATQENSFQIKGKGSMLRADDVAALRRW